MSPILLCKFHDKLEMINGNNKVTKNTLIYIQEKIYLVIALYPIIEEPYWEVENLVSSRLLPGNHKMDVSEEFFSSKK